MELELAVGLNPFDLKLDYQCQLQRKTLAGHPAIYELVVEQRVVLPRDPRELLGDFWPEDESIDDFLS